MGFVLLRYFHRIGPQVIAGSSLEGLFFRRRGGDHGNGSRKYQTGAVGRQDIVIIIRQSDMHGPVRIKIPDKFFFVKPGAGQQYGAAKSPLPLFAGRRIGKLRAV